MTTVSLPNTNFNILPAQQAAQTQPHRVLITGVMLSGTASTGTLVTDVGSAGEEDALFGAKSHIAMMIRNFKRYNPLTPVDAIGYTNAGGTAATGTIAFSGTATAAGTIYVTTGSAVDHKYALNVAVGDTATNVGDALVAALAADAHGCMTGVNTTGSVALTASNKGTVGNNLTLEVTGLPAGITASITAMASGATDPTITGLSTLIDNRRYQGVVYPGTWATSTIDSLMDARLNVQNNVLDGVAIMCKVDSHSNLLSWIVGLNNPLVVGFGEPLVARTALKGAAHREFADGLAAKFAAIRALRLTADLNIANYVISTNNGLDQYGGRHTASLPYFNTPMANVPLITQGDGFTPAQVASLKAACVSVIGNNIANNTTIVGEVVTTYLTDAAGNSNTSFKYLENIDTMLAIREYFWVSARAQYAQCRLTDGNLIPGYTMANRDSIKAFMVGLYNDMADEALLQAGEDAIKFFKQNMLVTLNLQTGTVTIDMRVPVVVQLRTINANLRISFDTNS